MKNLKDRRNPTLEESVKGVSKQFLEDWIEFDLTKIEENYNPYLEANLKIMIKEYEKRYIKDERFAKDSDTIIRFNEYGERLKKSCKQGIVYSK